MIDEQVRARPGMLLSGDEAVALGALHAGVSAAYAYPGTPSTEILEYLIPRADEAGMVAHWSANEKTAYEQALGVSMMGRRAVVAMKHVGLNVAADPFVNSALVQIDGGLVVAVADDPGMHSSQNEQDSRYLADFARVACLEPADAQEAYDMTRAAFEMSERFHIPVLVRLVTRLAHARSLVVPGDPLPPRPLDRSSPPADWTLLPGNARRLWWELLETQPQLREASEASPFTTFTPGTGRTGVITCGIARDYYLENLPDLPPFWGPGVPADGTNRSQKGSEEGSGAPPHLHIGAYPAPARLIGRLAEKVDRIIVFEEGYPFLERQLRGLLPTRWAIDGKENGALPPAGEITPEAVRTALGLAPRPRIRLGSFDLPARPPQLCKGCPHSDSYDAVKLALQSFPDPAVTADIGCYTLGALPPYEAIESCVCMGASIGMAKGVADAGGRPALAVIGDGTFLHSGITPLMDAVAAGTDMTVLILDNQTIAMTGEQPTILPDTRLEPIIRGLGVDPDHLHVVEILPRRVEELAALLRTEMEYPGLSIIVAVRPCVELVKHQKRAARS